MQTDDPKQIMTLQELSAYIRIAESSVYKLVRQGKIPGQKVGKTWRFLKGAIDAWLSEMNTTIENERKAAGER